ncbi:hypothetical protein MMC14_001442 [Varicellaria rhodocarpa]|nr:hypothetical protein [Varicellaria rhodocarpa]
MPPKQAKGEYIETETGNKVSRRSQIHGTQNIILAGRTVIQAEACIRGDLIRTLPSSSSSATEPSSSSSAKHNVAIAIGRYSFISTGAVLHPPGKLHRGVYSHHPLKIGDNVYVGPGCVIEAASIGNMVWIGKGAVVGNMAIIKDGVKVLEGAVVPAGMVVASGSVIGGRPGRVVGEVGIGWEGVDGREMWKNIG